MPEGRLGAWRWMLRGSDARRSTYRGAGWAVTRVIDAGFTYWCVSGDAWWVGFRFEAKRESTT